MKRTNRLWICFAIWIAFSSLFSASKCLGEVDPQHKNLFFKVPSFTLLDDEGRPYEFDQIAKNRKLVLIYAYGVGCPIVRKSLESLQKMKTEHGNKLAIIIVDSNLQNNPDRVRNERLEYKIKLPLLLDDTQQIARLLKIERTGEGLLVDSETRQILFRGPVSKQFNYNEDLEEGQPEPLNDAVKTFLNGNTIEKPYVASLGCAVNVLPLPKSNFYRDIAPIMETRCNVCHGQGVPPTNLTLYEDVVGWSKMLAETVLTERMPPWRVNTKIVKVHDDFKLSADEKNKIYGWLENGLEKGSEKDAVRNREKKKSRKNSKDDFSKPDFVWEMKEDFHLKSTESRRWHFEELYVNGAEDLWIQDLKFDSTNPRINHPPALVVTSSRLDLSKREFDPTAGNREALYSVIKGFEIDRSKKPYAYRIPAGHFVYLKIHFLNSGKDETVRVTTRVKGYASSKKPVELKFRSLSLRKFEIPAGFETHSETRDFPIAKNVNLLRVDQHMHSRGYFSKLEEVFPGGETKTIFSARFLPKYDYLNNLAQVIPVKAGSVLRVTFEFQNRDQFKQPISNGPDFFKNEMGAFHVIYEELN